LSTYKTAPVHIPHGSWLMHPTIPTNSPQAWKSSLRGWLGEWLGMSYDDRSRKISQTQLDVGGGVLLLPSWKEQTPTD
jgi:hypothetical protein